ncbi:MAG TPA: hypothetical protein VEI28_06910 [Thermodesulfovibrionales bacterium]|nr:hypothetical protein [Thermodesulfovibrionales bacterium]
MKTGKTETKMTYVGAGAGFVLFSVIGLLPGPLLGGAIGLDIAGTLFGFPVISAIMPRLIVGMSMVMGVLVSAVLPVTGCILLGWLMGCAVDSIKVERDVEAEAKH